MRDAAPFADAGTRPPSGGPHRRPPYHPCNEEAAY